MGFLSRLLGLATRKSAGSSSTPPPMAFGPSSASFFAFSEIEKNTTVIACTNIIANAISIFPLNLYFTDPKTGEKKKAGRHPLYAILKNRPNSAESPTQFKQKLLRHILTKGNVYLFKAKDGQGNVVSLQILNPEWVRETYEGWKTIYNYAGVGYTEEDILHIPALYTDDHGHGKSPVDLARAAVTLGNQFDQAALTAFGAGVNSKLIIDISDALKDVTDPDQQQKIIQQYADYVARTYSGPANAGKPFFPLNGMKPSEMKGGASNREDELLESRKWQFNEICKVFNLPGWLVEGTYNVSLGLEAAMILVLNFALMPWIRHLEEKFETLLTPYEQGVFSVEFDFSALLRVDQAARGAFWKDLFGLGAISPDEIAAAEGLPASTDGAGSTRFVLSNLMPVRNDVLDAYMSKAKAIAAGMLDTQAPTTAAEPPINSAVQ